jgi:hypothetical protein
LTGLTGLLGLSFCFITFRLPAIGFAFRRVSEFRNSEAGGDESDETQSAFGGGKL